MILVRVNHDERNQTHFSVRFPSNAGLTIKKKNDLKSKYTNGPISRQINRRKMLTLFKKVIY
jgi:ribosomal protein L14